MVCVSNTKNRFSRFDIFAALCFIAAFVFLLWKAPYGIASYDELFYLNVPYRLLQGDAMLIHEWHPGQLFSFLLYPAVWLFMNLKGSSEGIVFFFRLLFVVAQLMGAMYIYIRLSKLQPLGALLGSIALMLYAPSHRMALSYNTMAILMLSAACVTMLAEQRINISAPLSGLLFAGSVLCCPYLVLVYFVYSICALVPAVSKKLDIPAFGIGYWLRFTGSCAVLAAAFLIFIFSRCSLSELFSSIPHILNDPEHPAQSFGTIIYKYIEAIYGNFYFSNYTHIIIFSLCIPLLAVIMLVDKKRIEHRIIYIIPAIVITAAFFVYYIFNDRTVAFLMFPLNILGFFSYFLTKRRDFRPFVLLFIPGIMYSFCIHLGSNLGLKSIGSALTVSSIASAIYIVGLFRELLEDRLFFPRLIGFTLIAALFLQLSVLTYFRARYTARDGETLQLSVTLNEGPEKGLHTGPGKAAHYYSLIEQTAPVRDYDGETVTYLFTNTFLYLADDKKCGSFSNWMSFIFPEAEINRLSAYWQMHPDKIPEAIFIEDKEDKLELLLDILPGKWSVVEAEAGYMLFIQS